MKRDSGVSHKQDWWSWLLVLLCSSLIFATIPLARSAQQFVYRTAGKEFFTYFVVFTLITGTVALLYFLVFRLKVKKRAQYIWIVMCAGLFLYNTVRLDKHPEEAVHFLEYGILSYFIFRALSNSVRDTTIYFSALLCVSLVGTFDEFIQWLIPKRYWDFRDIGLNVFAGGVFLLGIWKGFRPEIIHERIRKRSVALLAGLVTANLIFIGLCLSNTPDAVKRYTEFSDSLLWLRNEEPMADYGYIHEDEDIGNLYSRLTVKHLEETDIKKGKGYGEILRKDFDRSATLNDLIATHNRYSDSFLYEFVIHLKRRDEKLLKIIESEKSSTARSLFIALKENRILERYFGNTLTHSGLQLSEDFKGELKNWSSLWEEEYESHPGAVLITSFRPGTAQMIIIFSLILVWTIYGIWTTKIKNQK